MYFLNAPDMLTTWLRCDSVTSGMESSSEAPFSLAVRESNIARATAVWNANKFVSKSYVFGRRHRHTISNFTAVQLQLFDIVILLDILFRFVFISDFRSAILMVLLEFAEQGFPYLFPSLVVERIVANRYMNARHKRFVKMSHAIGGQKEDASEIF